MISIIIPVYNVEEYVGACLDSVISQNPHDSVECIIVDDCATDSSMEAVEKCLSGYEGKISFKIIHHDQNRGLSAARNTGIHAAAGDYLLFLDSDDTLLPDALNHLSEIAIKYPQAQIVQGNIKCTSTNGIEKYLTITKDTLPDFINGKNVPNKAILNSLPATAWGKLVKRQFVIDNDLYFVEGIYHEDEMWRVMASRHVTAIACCFSPIYLYRVENTNSIMNKKDKSPHFLSRIEVIRECINGQGGFKPEIMTEYLNNQLLINYKNAIWPDIRSPKKVTQHLRTLCLQIARNKMVPFKYKAMALCNLLPVSITKSKPFLTIYYHAFCKH